MNAQCNETPAAMLDDDAISTVAIKAAAAVEAARERGTVAHEDARIAHGDEVRKRVALERTAEDAPTREYHSTPCAALLSHVAELVRMARETGALRAYLISATVGVALAIVTAGGWFLVRDDGLADRMAASDERLTAAGQSREVAISVMQARMSASDVSTAASLSRLDTSIGKLEGKLDALAAQVATLSRQQPQPQYTVP